MSTKTTPFSRNSVVFIGFMIADAIGYGDF
jgi:hypothetical protein